MSRCLRKQEVMDMLKQGKAISVIPDCKGGRRYYFDQDNAPSLTVRSDLALRLQRDGLVKRSTDNIWAMSYDLIPTDKLKGVGQE
jgi:hypothetical protein